MSEQDEQRPLTRRERRIRDLGETGAMDLSEAIGNDAAASDAPAAASEPAVAAGDVEISPFHEDGTPRSRREMRQLREEALAARGGSEAAAAEPAAEEPAGEASETPEAIVVEPIDVAENDSAPETAAEALPEAEAQPAPETKTNEQDAVDDVIVAEPLPSAPSLDSEPEPAIPDFDSLMSPPTEPFTVDELREAEAAGDASVDTVDAGSADGVEVSGEAQAAESAVSGEFAESAASQPVADDTVAAAVGEAPAKSKRRFPWQRSKSNDQVADAPVADSEPAIPEVDVESASVEPATTVLETAAPATEVVEVETVVDDPAPAEESPAEAAPVEAAPVDASPVEVLPAPAEPAEHLPVVDAEPAADPVPAPEQAEAVHPDQRTSYSFPDIAPPEEWRSVFDDPSGRQFPTPGDAQGSGDFDDLISRAVAQEGSTGGTGTSALILPTMPEDTGGLTGPLGATGDMYVTGSLKLPKSLGETGGHSALHDSIEMDPITGDQLSEPGVSSDGPAPVSARHAVSARVDSGVPVVAKPTREKSKLPLVLSLTGGGLLVVVVGLGAWGASNGFFG